MMVDSVRVERTVRRRVEVRNAREHRRLERLFRAAQEARNAIIEDVRPTRAWNLRELRRQRRVDPEWQPECQKTVPLTQSCISERRVSLASW